MPDEWVEIREVTSEEALDGPDHIVEIVTGEPGARGIKGDQGDPGETGPAGGGVEQLSYTHYQGVAATEWVVLHNLGYHPSVQVVDSGGTVVEGDIIYDSVNQLRLRFAYAFSGTVYLS